MNQLSQKTPPVANRPVFIHGIGTAVPQRSLTQDEAVEQMRATCRDPRTQRVIRRVARQSAIAKRHLAVLDDSNGATPGPFYRAASEQPRGPGMGARTAFFDAAAGDLVRRAIDSLPLETVKKAETLADSIIEKAPHETVITVAHDKTQYNEFVSKSDLLVNATPCGAKKNDPALFDYSYIHEKLYVFDLTYSQDTALLKEARSRGARAINGLNMLIYQAAASFSIWTGKDAPLEVMKKAAKEKIGK